jgi:hypothetical protein
MGAAVHAFSEEGRIGDVADYLAKTFDISESAACAHAAHLATLWA